MLFNMKYDLFCKIIIIETFIIEYLIILLIYFEIMILNLYGDWGLGIGDWGLGIGPNPQSPIPKPPSPIPNPPFL